MFARNEDILMLDDHRANHSGGAVDHVAAAGAALVAALGAAQIFAPALVSPMTGIENGTGAQIVGAQWALLGGLLAAGGLFRLRVLTIFAAEFLLIAGLAAMIVVSIKQPNMVHVLIHGGVAFIGLTSSGLARLSDKADLKRELRIARETAKQAHENAKTAAPAKEIQHV